MTFFIVIPLDDIVESLDLPSDLQIVLNGLVHVDGRDLAAGGADQLHEALVHRTHTRRTAVAAH